MRFPRFVPILACLMLNTFFLFSQSPNGNINGLVSDPSSAAVVGADVVAVNDATRVQYTTRTNSEGIYVLPNLPPGPYRVQVSKIGFKTIIKPDIVLNVQDALSINFSLPVGAAHEVLTVEGGASPLNSESSSVSTVVDRQFAENLPLNGRSFQTLIMLTPGVVVVPTNGEDNGQFSINGQRASANYWMVDGVSANIGVGASYGGNGVGGAAGSFSVMGGTNSLVSVDAMQEFRIQTSTYAPEFGRTPGGQVSIVTRSGNNQFHGTVFDYLRNDVLDANNWFNGYTNVPPLPKAEERQNDFGGTLAGPIRKDKTFFFFSYEGLRLRLPEVALTSVPDLGARQSATATMQSYLDAYPLPNGPDNIATGVAQFNKGLSNPATLDAYSLRLDQTLSNRWSLFGRYSNSPSWANARGGGPGAYGALNSVSVSQIKSQTATMGSAWTASPVLTNDVRFNSSRVSTDASTTLDNFGGAVPLTVPPYPGSYNDGNANFSFFISTLGVGEGLAVGNGVAIIQHQLNVVDTLAWQKGPHSLKFGVDFRRLTPEIDPARYTQTVSFNDIPSSLTGINASGSVSSVNDAALLFRNVGAYAQDSWRIGSRLMLTYGLRWDVDAAPKSLSGPAIPAVTGYNAMNFSELALAPAGTPPFRTTYANFAPRLGAAYSISQIPGRQLVLRGGFGVFYDLVSAETGNAVGSQYPPFGAFTSTYFNGTFPFSPSQIAPLPIPSTGTLAELYAFNPHLKLPYTLQWNVALEHSFGADDTLSASYVGAAGKRLLQTTLFASPPQTFPPTPDFVAATFVDNMAVSNYQSLQLQFRQRLSHNFQALISYAWAHSIDDGSASSSAILSNLGGPGTQGQNRGNSDFDVRNTFTAGLTYDLPEFRGGRLMNAIARGWSTEEFILARSAPPISVYDVNFFLLAGGNYAAVRPDIVPGQLLYEYGSQYPGHKALNLAAFVAPPADPNTGIPLRQGDLARNALRGFGATQWDFAVHRDFPLPESLKLQFRAEMFNVLNHPNFGQPSGRFGASGFGLSSQMLNQSLSGSQGTGGFSPLYQIGGPRSIQFALKLIF
jgi:Carboxypeptidase regulatory-like domain/TonB dependent receptor